MFSLNIFYKVKQIIGQCPQGLLLASFLLVVVIVSLYICVCVFVCEAPMNYGDL